MAKINVYADKHYAETCARIPPYLIGILLGWILYKTKDKPIYIHKVFALNNYLKSKVGE